MRKLFVSSLLASMALAGIAGAQVLNTTAITDQFDTGSRGNAAGTGGSFGDALVTGTEFADYSGADSTGGPIRYINAYAGASPGDATNSESPVLAVTNVGNPDRSLLGNTIPANALSGATGGSNVILISDDGGQNTLAFGDPASTDYFVEVDVYCYARAAQGGSEFAMVAVRAARNDVDNATANSGAYSIDREASYAIVYDYKTSIARAVVFADNNAAVTGAAPVAVGTPTSALSEAWHRFRVQAVGTTITYSVDGTTIASITDATVTAGRGAIGYREGSVASADERAGTFDNLKAGPASAAVSEWSVY